MFTTIPKTNWNWMFHFNRCALLMIMIVKQILNLFHFLWSYLSIYTQSKQTNIYLIFFSVSIFFFFIYNESNLVIVHVYFMVMYFFFCLFIWIWMINFSFRSNFGWWKDVLFSFSLKLRNLKKKFLPILQSLSILYCRGRFMTNPIFFVKIFHWIIFWPMLLLLVFSNYQMKARYITDWIEFL